MRAVTTFNSYRPIERGTRLYQGIVDYVEQLIIEGKLQQGDRLPPESELAEQLGVSRTAVREAVKALHEKGLVSVEVGRGTFIVSPSPNRVAEQYSLLLRLEKVSLTDLTAARNLLEVEIASLAAQHRTEEDLARLRENVREMENILNFHETFSPDTFSQLGTAFHEALARATGNQVYGILIQPIIALMNQTHNQLTRDHSDFKEALHYHREVLACIEAQDPEAAKALMKAHLTQMY